MKLHAFIAIYALTHIATLAQAAEKPTTKDSYITSQNIYDDMEKTMGVVPSFAKQLPKDALVGMWEEYKATELNPNSQIGMKYKALIGLGVSAQIPCSYCVYYSLKSARLYGATDEEIGEAVSVAATTQHWSTLLQGMQPDMATFKTETASMFDFEKKGTGKPMPLSSIVDDASAQKDIEQHFGTVPTMYRNLPPGALMGAWKQMKAVELNPNSRIPAKYKEMIGMAVASQVPCNYCTYFHTEAARNDGASTAEINEALTLAAITRNFSTVLIGLDTDEATFRKEMDKAFMFFKKQMTATPPKGV